ncbi:MAG: tetratricopeptide repeat protein [Kiritimatiellia bacterium]
MAENIPDELKAVRDFVSRYQRYILAVLFVAAAAVFVIRYYSSTATGKEREAQRILFRSRTVQDLRSFLDDYAGTPSAPLARLKLAKMLFNNGRYAAALDQYSAFERDYPEHYFLPAANMGHANALYALGHVSEALSVFNEFLGEYPAHYLRSQALLGRARCLETRGRIREAIEAYTRFAAEHPDSPGIEETEEALDKLTSEPAPTLPPVENP